MCLVICCQCYQPKLVLVLQLARSRVGPQVDSWTPLASSVWLLSRRVAPIVSCLLDAFQVLSLLPHWQPSLDRLASV